MPTTTLTAAVRAKPDLEAAIVNLRDAGLTFRRVAEIVGYSDRWVRHCYHVAKSDGLIELTELEQKSWLVGEARKVIEAVMPLATGEPTPEDYVPPAKDDVAVALKAIGLMADLLGLKPTRKTNVTANVGVTQVWTDKQVEEAKALEEWVRTRANVIDIGPLRDQRSELSTNGHDARASVSDDVPVAGPEPSVWDLVPRDW